MANQIPLTEEIKTRILEMAAKGYIDKEIYTTLGISKSKYYVWLSENKDFLDILKAQKRRIDNEVEQKLFKRAMGYEYEEATKEMVKTENGEELKITKVVVKSVAPDVTAQIFWLKNRQPENWRDRQDHNLSGTLTANIPALDACVAEIMKGK